MKMKDAELASWQALWSGDEGPVAPVLDARRIATQGRRGSSGGWPSNRGGVRLGPGVLACGSPRSDHSARRLAGMDERS